MNTQHTPLIVAALATILPLLSATAAADQPQRSHRVAFELGDAEFAPGDSITIEEVRGTRPTIVAGETYSVSGRYTLGSRSEADLSLFVTTTNRTPTPIVPDQTMRLKKGSGTFRLSKTLDQDGYLHLTFYPVSGGNGFGGVYFGEGKWVLRDKHFSYRAPAVTASEGSSTAPGTSSAKGPNQVLFEYLGDPVDPPSNMDAAYSKENLSKAIYAAAHNAGIPVKTSQIDASEFPFLVGLVCGPGDFTKLKDAVNAMSAYEWSGGVSSDTCLAINIVPSRAFPPQSAQRIYHRLTLREAVLFDKISRR